MARITLDPDYGGAAPAERDKEERERTKKTTRGWGNARGARWVFFLLDYAALVVTTVAVMDLC